MAERIVTIRNQSGQRHQVRESHPVLNLPGVKRVADEPEASNEALPYEEWSSEELREYAEAEGIDVGQARSPARLAQRIRAAEE